MKYEPERTILSKLDEQSIVCFFKNVLSLCQIAIVFGKYSVVVLVFLNTYINRYSVDMLIAMGAPRKPQRLCGKVVRFPRILENDSFDIDSLDGNSDNDVQIVSSFHIMKLFICCNN